MEFEHKFESPALLPIATLLDCWFENPARVPIAMALLLCVIAPAEIPIASDAPAPLPVMNAPLKLLTFEIAFPLISTFDTAL
jgi:hypothetical protein